MEYFFEVQGNGDKPVLKENSYEAMRKYLEQTYNYADLLRSLRFEEERGDGFDAFDALLKEVKEIETKFDEYPEHRDELRKLEILTLGNIWLRKGQYLDEGFHDSKECYQMAVKLLWQICDPSAYNCDSLLVYMNLGKYFRNRGKMGRRSYYKSAENGFDHIIKIIEKNVTNTTNDTIESWEMHLWLEAKINVGRGQKSDYDLDAAEISFWEIARNLYDRLPEDEEKLCNKSNIWTRLQSDKILCDAYATAKQIPMYEKTVNGVHRKRVYALYREYFLQALLQLAIIYRKKHIYEQAELLCDIILECMDSNNIDAQNEKGACLRKRGKEEAIKFLESNGVQGNRFAKLNLWKCKLAQGNLKEKDIEEELKRDAHNPEILLIKGGILKQSGKWEEAYEVYKEVYDGAPYIRQGTNALKAYYNMAKCLLAQNQVYQAKQILEKIDADCKKKDVKARIVLGQCYMKLANYKEASAIYESLISEIVDENGVKKIGNRWIINSETEVELYCNCGECYCRLGQREKAATMFQEALNIEPHKVEAVFGKAQCQFINEDESIIKTESSKDMPALKINYKDILTKMKEVADQCPTDSRFISELAIARMKYIDLAPTNENEVRGHMKADLQYLQGPYSLMACIAFASFVESEAERLSTEQKAQMEELFRAFSRIEMDAQEEGYSTFGDLQKEPAFQRLDAVMRGKVLIKLYKIYGHIVGIKNVCRDTGNMKGIPVHYTKIDTLKKLLSTGERNIVSSVSPRMRLWNSVYMNDPFEGEKFIDLIKEEVKSEVDPRIADEILKKYFLHLTNRNSEAEVTYSNLKPVNSNVYITSFSMEEDNIQMWVQYADGAQGCNIAFDESFFDIHNDSGNLDGNSNYSDMDYPLYKIQYIEGNNLNSSEELKKIKKHIKEIWVYLKKIEDEVIGKLEKGDSEKEEVIRSFVANCLNEVRFLFKDKEYEHEGEYRIVKYSHSPEIDDEHFRIPRLYIEVDREIQMKRIMLGPKVSQQEVNEIVSWLYATKRVKQVTQSLRHYK